MSEQGPRRLVEVGVESPQRALRLVQAAEGRTPATEIQYIGIDLFEAGGGPALKDTYRTLRASGARVQLLPGEPTDAFMQHANNLGHVDLLILSARANWQAVPRIWFYVPRLMHGGTQIFIEQRDEQGQLRLDKLGRIQLDVLVSTASLRRAA